MLFIQIFEFLTTVRLKSSAAAKLCTDSLQVFHRRLHILKQLIYTYKLNTDYKYLYCRFKLGYGRE